MIQRNLSKYIKSLSKKMPALALTGPRQSGKTTLLKETFPKYDYVNLEHPPTRLLASSDPDLFLSQFTKGVIIDEVQRVPELFSYLQVIIDQEKKNGKYILSGSQNFLLLENIGQSLAGRVVLLNLLPFSLPEMQTGKITFKNVQTYIYKGSYPAIFDRKISPDVYYTSYISTYVERDVRQLLNVQNLSTFELFLQILAGRIGQLINYSEIGNALGLDNKTIKKWISVLEASYIVYLVQPYYKNYNKRLVKTPKLYFYDTGLACNLLGIRNEKEITTHWVSGALFENLVITETIKTYHNKAQKPHVYFWRDNIGNEVDLLIQDKNMIQAVEIKSSKTFHGDFFKGLNRFADLAKVKSNNCYLVYNGQLEQKTKSGHLINWESFISSRK